MKDCKSDQTPLRANLIIFLRKRKQVHLYWKQELLKPNVLFLGESWVGRNLDPDTMSWLSFISVP